MNMTVVIISKRSAVEFVALCLLIVSATGSLSNAINGGAGTAQGQLARQQQQQQHDEELPASIEVVGDEQRQLDDQELGSIVKDFGEHLKDTMEEEMERLISEVEAHQPTTAPSDHKREKVDQAELVKLREANKAAGEDIQARIELVGDNKGALPQMALGTYATSFAAAASGRLAAAGSYIGNKMRSLGNNLKAKIPAKLRRFFKWPTFLKFKIRFHKTYRSLREELYRQMIFLRSHIVVGMQHVRFLLGRDKHLTGQNQYSDWTEKEYHEKEGNHDGERSAADLDPSALVELQDSTKSKLEALAKSGENIFGQPVLVGEKKRRRRRDASEADNDDADDDEGRQAKRQRRAKRDVDSDGDEDMDELNDNEDEDGDFDGMDLGNDLEPMQEDQAEEPFKLLDEFANDLDMTDLDDIDENLDEVLGQTDDFKPIDLRDTGCIGKAENQNGCGCCYSYALHSAASYYNCMDKKLDKPDRYHARFVADCGRYLTPEGRYPAVNSCHGGRISKAYAFAQLVGVQRFAHYNIARVSAKLSDPEACVYPRPEDLAKHGWSAVIEPVPVFQKSRFALLKPDEVDLHLRTVGPVVVNVRTWKNFKFYEGGILNTIEEGESSTLHSMLIVGHDKDAKGRDYWIILNSHGIVWGERGYLRVYNDALKNFAVIYGGLAPLDMSA